MTSKTMRSAGELIDAGLLSPGRRRELDAVAARYSVALTAEVADLIDRGAKSDPLARQYLPAAEELDIAPEERSDPIGDRRWSPVKGLVHRYPDRVLLMPVQACAVYCRFCFRRETVGPGKAALSPSELHRAIEYIVENRNIWEVILSGGDPLLLSPRRLRHLVAALANIDHVGVIRVHTRLPMAAPNRISPSLIEALACDKALWLSIHANHANEFGAAQRAAIRKLAKAGIPLIGQSVLLKGINDNAAALEDLFRTMVANRIKPYYLHHPDLARGTAHFRLDIGAGQDVVARLRGRVSGMCQPTYVLDIPGGYGKVPLTPGHAVPLSDQGDWQVRDLAGRLHAYPPACDSSPGEVDDPSHRLVLAQDRG